jgi:hypothetical protein
MKRCSIIRILLLACTLVGIRYAVDGQAPAAASDPDIPISHRDRVYTAEQFSNTVSVTDPVDNKLLGAIHLGDPIPSNLSPLTRDSCWCTAWDFHPIIAPSPSLPSARMR